MSFSVTGRIRRAQTRTTTTAEGITESFEFRCEYTIDVQKMVLDVTAAGSVCPFEDNDEVELIVTDAAVNGSATLNLSGKIKKTTQSSRTSGKVQHEFLPATRPAPNVRFEDLSTGPYEVGDEVRVRLTEVPE